MGGVRLWRGFTRLPEGCGPGRPRSEDCGDAQWISTPGLECAINAGSSALDEEQSGNECSAIIHRDPADRGTTTGTRDPRRSRLQSAANWTSPAIPPILPPDFMGRGRPVLRDLKA